MQLDAQVHFLADIVYVVTLSPTLKCCVSLYICLKNCDK